MTQDRKELAERLRAIHINTYRCSFDECKCALPTQCAKTRAAQADLRAAADALAGEGEPVNLRTFCPECGVNVAVDGDGCCVSCGSNATVTDRAFVSLQMLRLPHVVRASPPESGRRIEGTLRHRLRIPPGADHAVLSALRLGARMIRNHYRPVGPMPNAETVARVLDNLKKALFAALKDEDRATLTLHEED